MATTATLNILLNLQASQMRAGLRNAMADYQRFANQVTNLTQGISYASIRQRDALSVGNKPLAQAWGNQITLLQKARVQQQEYALAARQVVQQQQRGYQVMNEGHRVQKLNQQSMGEVKSAAVQMGRGIQEAAQAVQVQRRAVVQGAIALGSFAVANRLVATASRPLFRAFDGFASIVTNLIGPSNALGQTISTVFSTVGELAGSMVGMAGKAVGGIIAFASAGVGTFFSVIGGMFTGFGVLLGTIATVVGTAFFGPVGAIVGAAIGGITAVVFSFLGAIPTAIGSMISAVGGAIGGVVSGIASMVGEVTGRVFSLAGQVVGGVVGKMAELGMEAIQVAAHFEQMQISFSVMTGSATKAKAVLDDLIQFAAVTPFQIKDLTKNTQLLTAMGFEVDTAVGLIKKLGDVAAAMPEGMEAGLDRITRAIGTMQAKGTVQAREMTRLAQAGIPVWQALANRLSLTAGRAISVGEAMRMVEDRAVSSREGIAAILDVATSPKFAGMMARQVTTISGLFSNLKDNVTIIMREVGDMLTEALNLKGMTVTVTALFGFLKSRMEDIKPAIMVVGAVIQQSFEIIGTVVRKAFSAFADFTKGIDVTPEKLFQIKLAVVDTFEKAALMGVEFGEKVTNAVIGIINWMPKLNEVFIKFKIYALAAMEGVLVGVRLLSLGGVAGVAALGKINEALKEVRELKEKAFREFGAAPAQPIPLVNFDQQRAQVRGLGQELRNNAVAGTQAAKAATAVGMALMPLGAVAALQVQGLLGLTKAVGGVTLPLGDLNVKITDTIKEMRSPMKALQDEIRDTNALIAQAMPGAFKMARHAGNDMFTDLILYAAQSRVAVEALNKSSELNQAKRLNDLRSKFGVNRGDVAAMEAGSTEAVSAINRALNKAGEGNDVVAEMKMLTAIAKQQEDIQREIGRTLINGLKNMGVR